MHGRRVFDVQSFHCPGPAKFHTRHRKDIQGMKYEVSRTKAILILIILTLLYMMAYMDRSVMTVVVELMKADIGLTDGQIGFLQTTFMVSVGLTTSLLYVDRIKNSPLVSESYKTQN
jgi:sugar phosphate permease